MDNAIKVTRTRTLRSRVGTKLALAALIDHMIGTYFYLRVLLAIIGFAFPFALWAFSWTDGVGIENSMSAYYHADRKGVLDIASRDVFVGGLFAVAGLLAAYKAYGKGEEWLLSGAAVAAIGVALFPECQSNCSALGLHNTSAILFFVLIALAVSFCSANTLDREESDLKNPEWYRRMYWVFGALMLLGPATAFVFHQIGRFEEYIFIAETLAIWAFSAYWLVKTIELQRSKLDQKVKSAGGQAR